MPSSPLRMKYDYSDSDKTKDRDIIVATTHLTLVTHPPSTILSISQVVTLHLHSLLVRRISLSSSLADGETEARGLMGPA